VLIAVPHTSNWDLPIGLICAHAIGLLANRRYGFMAKASVFKGPFDSLMKWLGGIPIQRDAAQDVVKQFVDIFNTSDELMLVITPEGTRKHRPYWKSGFYRIALAAKVPIVMAYIDYKRRAAGIGPTLMPTGYIGEDLDVIRKFYSTVTAKFPQSVGKIDFNIDEMMR
jgi:1-acyl-sn-glycerol-3-phosphate acyltransferase